MTQYIGNFIPRNPKKYHGDSSRIIFRSLWERRCMVMWDEDDRVVQWSSEELIVPYRSPKDGLIHRYFPDFIVVFQMPDGTQKVKMVEVKPAKKLIQPVPNKKVTQKFLKELLEFETIQCKGRAAQAFCADRGWEYVFITENDLFPKKRHK
jgi:hypothetical protein